VPATAPIDRRPWRRGVAGGSGSFTALAITSSGGNAGAGVASG
jgi:hypothetical protein